MTINPRNARSLTRLIFKKSSVTPDFFTFLNLSNLILILFHLQSKFKKICTWDILGANVLKLLQQSRGNQVAYSDGVRQTLRRGFGIFHSKTI